jgi:hypothetical protein
VWIKNIPVYLACFLFKTEGLQRSRFIEVTCYIVVFWLKTRDISEPNSASIIRLAPIVMKLALLCSLVGGWGLAQPNVAETFVALPDDVSQANFPNI